MDIAVKLTPEQIAHLNRRNEFWKQVESGEMPVIDDSGKVIGKGRLVNLPKRIRLYSVRID
jgi:hypothetical protein